MPSKAQATKFPTFGAFKKFETHMQNRLPSSTENSYREEERDSRVFLKAYDEPARQLNPDRDKIFNFPKNNFFQQISQHKKSPRIFASGESVAARNPLEFHHGIGLCFNPDPLFGVYGNVERPNDDYERAASLDRHNLPASGTFDESALENSAPVLTPPSLHNCVGGNPANFHFPTSISLGFQFGKSARALNSVPPVQFGKSRITPALIDPEKFVADNDHCRLNSPEADRESGSGSDLSLVAGNCWIATMSSHGSEEAAFCQHQRISVTMLSHVWHASSIEAYQLELSRGTSHRHVPTI